MNSVIKARQVRYLVPICKKLAAKYEKPGNTYTAHRAKCFHHLNDMYDIIDSSLPRLSEENKGKFEQSTMLFLLNYSKCAEICFHEGTLQWSIVPKHHLAAHLPLQAQYLSPRIFWAYGGEHMVGTVAALGQACLAGTPGHKVSLSLTEKFRIAWHFFMVRVS